MIPSQPITRFAGLLASGLLCGFAAPAVRADCAPIVAAYQKADATKRYAIYEVDSISKTAKGDPFMVAIGNVEYMQQYERKGPLQIVKNGYSKGGHAADFESNKLKEREKKGEVRCEPIGERTLGTDAAVGYRIRNNQPGNKPDYTAIEIWINRASGLPIFHGMGSDGGGFRWVYGAAVVPPPGAN